MAREFRFRLSLTKEQVLSIYTGQTQKVMVTTDTGLRVLINAKHLRKFTTADGIYGSFRMVVDDHNEMVGIEKL